MYVGPKIPKSVVTKDNQSTCLQHCTFIIIDTFDSRMKRGLTKTVESQRILTNEKHRKQSGFWTRNFLT